MRHREYIREKIGMVQCEGHAHQNLHIGLCGLCLPYEWGKVPAYKPIDLALARELKLDVRFGDLTDAQLDEVEELIQQGVAVMVNVTRKCTNYNVLRWL